MAMSDPAPLMPLAESIADGNPIDWPAVERGATADEQGIIRQLRILANLAVLHRSLPAANPAETMPAIAPRTHASPAIGNWAHLALVERLGSGTFGVVYRAWDRRLEREVALKLLHVGQSLDVDDDPQSSRIAREGRLLARVRHPNVITVHGVEVYEGRVGLCMELVRGTTLEALLRKRGAFSAKEASLIGIDLCRALAAIHAAGLIHRDVKAQNVIREDGGRIVLMDLGTGREIDPDRRDGLPDLAGTPLYLAPEIFDGALASEKTDLYSLGVLLYHIVTGAFPVQGTTIDELRERQAAGRGMRLRDARADLPTAFVRVVDRAIATDPARRYASAGAFEADLVQALEVTTPGAPAVEPVAVPAETLPTMWRRLAIPAAVVTAALVIAVLAWRGFRGGSVPPLAPGAIRSIAVLPLTNLSGDPSQEYLADGMTDELIGTLGRLGNVSVISRTSVMQFKNSKKSLSEIAKALNVDAVLEASLQVVPATDRDDRSGPRRVRINARLIYAGTDTQLWDRTFEQVVSDALALQSEVAAAVAEGIGLRLTAPQRSVQRAREHPQAQEAYLQGRYLLLNNASRDNFIRAREYLERSVQIDPEYAPAYASLARCYTFLDLYSVLSRREAARLADRAAATAAGLDDSLPEAHNQLASVAFNYRWDWTRAERAYRRAIELNPSYSFARFDYARFLMADNRLDEALAQARRARENDPLSAEAIGIVGLGLYYARRYDEAIAEYIAEIRMEPNSAQHHLSLGRAYAAKGQYDLAIAELQSAVTMSGQAPFIVAELARTYAAAGATRQAQDLLVSLTNAETAQGPHLPAQYHSYVWAALGQPDRAFEWLDRAVSDREFNLLWARVDPRFDSLRQDPRFAVFLRKLTPQP